MTEVSFHNKAFAAATAARDMEFDKLSCYMDKLRSSYQVLKRETTKLMQKNIDLTSSNKHITILGQVHAHSGGGFSS